MAKLVLCLTLPMAAAFGPRASPAHLRTAPLRAADATDATADATDAAPDAAPDEAARANRRTIFDFTVPSEVSLWERIDDVVMGGVSSSKVLPGIDGGSALWSGIVRTDGGGFCGTRTSKFEKPLDLSAFDGVAIDAALVSDDEPSRRAWKLTLRSNSERGEVVHSCQWQPRAAASGGGEFETQYIPFSDFRLARGPDLVKGAPPLDRESCKSIYGFGMTISKFGRNGPMQDFRDGPFRVELQGIGVYAPAEAEAAEVVVEKPRKEVVDPSRPNSAGKVKTPVVGAVFALLRPISNLVFSEPARRRGQARRLLVSSGRVSNGLAARLWGQNVVKRGTKGLSARSSMQQGLSELAADAVTFVISFPLKVLFKALFSVVKFVKKLKGGGAKAATA